MDYRQRRSVRNTYYNSDGGSRPWRRMRARVLREEPYCQVRLEGCTRVSTTVDHIIPKALRPDLVMSRENCRGSCRNCNLKKGKKIHMKRPSSRASAKVLAFFE